MKNALPVQRADGRAREVSRSAVPHFIILDTSSGLPATRMWVSARK